MTMFESVQKELDQVGCPACQKHMLELSLRCTFGGKMCLFAAQCKGCQYLFELNETSLKLAQTQIERDKGIKKSGCPACRDKNVEIIFRCDLPDRDWFFLATCHACHHVFKV